MGTVEYGKVVVGASNFPEVEVLSTAPRQKSGHKVSLPQAARAIK